ncbi:MAG: FxsA family protein, partial [Bradymonadaceae bacterium]
MFTIIPLIELALLIPLGMQIGLWPTIALVVGTG